MTTTDALDTIWKIRTIVEDAPGLAMFADLPAAVRAIKAERDELRVALRKMVALYESEQSGATVSMSWKGAPLRSRHGPS